MQFWDEPKQQCRCRATRAARRQCYLEISAEELPHIQPSSSAVAFVINALVHSDLTALWSIFISYFHPFSWFHKTVILDQQDENTNGTQILLRSELGTHLVCNLMLSSVVSTANSTLPLFLYVLKKDIFQEERSFSCNLKLLPFALYLELPLTLLFR